METDATYRGTVYPWQCDHVGHMNIMWYVGKFDEANWNLFARLGLTPSYLRESGRGMAAVQQNVTYKRELLAGDIVEVRSRLLEIRDKSIRFVHEMRNAETGEIAASLRVHRRPHRPAGAEIRAVRGRDPQRREKHLEPSDGVKPCRASSRKTRIIARSRPTRSNSSGRCRRSAFRSRGWSRARSIWRWTIRADLTQQNGFVHAGIITAGLDNACGIAAFTLMPAGSEF